MTDIRQKNSRFEKKYLLVLPFLLILYFVRISLFNEIDNDVWFLLNHGRYVIQHGLPFVEPFTIHAGFQFIMQQWLSAVIFWFVYSALGIAGINALVLLFYILIAFVIYKLCMKISENNFQISFMLTCSISYLIFAFMVARPYIFSTLIFAIALYCMENYIKTKRNVYLFILPLLSILLVNIHASMWPMLFVLMIPYLIDSLKFDLGPFSGNGYFNKTFLFSMLAIIPAGLINPYGIRGMTYLFSSYGINEINFMISEMRPPDINYAYGKLVFASLLLVFFMYLFNRHQKINLRYGLLTLGTAYLTLSSVRGFLFFAICGFFPLAYLLKDFKLKKRELPTGKLRRLRVILTLLLIASISLLAFALNGREAPQVPNYVYLNNTIEFVKQNSDLSKVKMYTSYHDGNLVEFNGIPSYLDTRADVFIKRNNKVEDIYHEYFKLQTGSLYYKDFLDKYQFTHLILTSEDLLYVNLVHDKDYSVVYTNERYTLFEKKKLESK